MFRSGRPCAKRAWRVIISSASRTDSRAPAPCAPWPSSATSGGTLRGNVVALSRASGEVWPRGDIVALHRVARRDRRASRTPPAPSASERARARAQPHVSALPPPGTRSPSSDAQPLFSSAPFATRKPHPTAACKHQCWLASHARALRAARSILRGLCPTAVCRVRALRGLAVRRPALAPRRANLAHILCISR